jgi:AcrR family transcriptional regulator
MQVDREKVKSGRKKEPDENEPVRERIMGAGFDAFLEHGYAKASTLEIATRARVSKRELYAQFKNKACLFEAGIVERTAGMSLPLSMPDAANRESLEATLTAFGVAALNGLTEPQVLAVYRLAAAEASRSPQIAAMLDRAGRGTLRRGVSAYFKSAIARGLIAEGDPVELCDEFCSLLLGDTMLRMLLGVAKKPRRHEIAARARNAAAAFLALHGNPAH